MHMHVHARTGVLSVYLRHTIHPVAGHVATRVHRRPQCCAAGRIDRPAAPEHAARGSEPVYVVVRL